MAAAGRAGGGRERILFVCTANVDRSRTAEDLYRGDPRYEVRSAGVAAYAAVPITREALLWADRVFVMNEAEDRHATILRLGFPDVLRPVVDLDIPDLWTRGDAELVALLLRQLRPYLGSPQTQDDPR
ncbi:MAG TPA: protein tyrosine phosphatase [Vicinamibacteria bacterium]|nr:protein tyrosine phosphatase [Vicinamibacteria bacterium]